MYIYFPLFSVENENVKKSIHFVNDSAFLLVLYVTLFLALFCVTEEIQNSEEKIHMKDFSEKKETQD